MSIEGPSYCCSSSSSCPGNKNGNDDNPAIVKPGFDFANPNALPIKPLLLKPKLGESVLPPSKNCLKAKPLPLPNKPAAGPAPNKPAPAVNNAILPTIDLSFS